MKIALPQGRPQGYPKRQKGQLLALLLTAAVVALVWWGAVQPLRDWYTSQAETLAQQQLLAFRMARIASALPSLRAQKAAAPAESTAPHASLPNLLLEGDTDEIAAANLQERLQALALSAGTSLNSVENLPAERQAGEPPSTERAIRLRITLVTQAAHFRSLLDAIEEGPPLMLVDDVRLSAPRLPMQAMLPLEASLTVTGFRHPAAAAATATAVDPAATAVNQ